MENKILGVKINNLYLAEVLESVEQFLNSPKQHYIVTSNPEFIVHAGKDEEFKEILNKSDISIADGMGIKFAAKKYGWKLKQRITGVDLLWEIASIAEKKNKSIYLLGSKRGVPQAAAYKLMEQFPKLRIVGAESGYRSWHRHIKDEKLIEMINRRQPDILFVALGHGKQEKWIARNLSKIPSVKLAMGVGGSFDYISGHIKRAPKLMRKMGLEWLYRLGRQPWRLPRILTAVIRFSYLVIKDKK
ncbi:MAG: WecB/TagA/CpsF family glycosyltransferase [bacterium]|nr:WecB/TagA/CpsF family glycosyltransferase [bacterium]